MKTATDPRHLKRLQTFKKLFTLGFPASASSTDIQPIKNHLQQIDDLISQCAPEWPISKLNKVDLAILRLAIYELLIDQQTPPKVVIDEAVEIAKQYGTEKTPKFINGVLGSVVKLQDKSIKPKAKSNKKSAK